MSDPASIVTDSEIERVHANANFGQMAKRDVLNYGVLSYAFGYSTGHTMLSILLEHGLLKKPKPGRYDSTLTVKGRDYLRAVYGPHFETIKALGVTDAPR